jgi:uncharacterized protein (TIGR00297 family)
VTNALLGVILAAVVALTALRARALTVSGAIAAFAIGATVFATAGWRGAAVLFAFFLPSALLSRLGNARKKALTDIGKHGPRDAWQVSANGGIAALCALLAIGGAAAYAAAFAGAFAAAAGDTWGTELGTLSRGQPRSIVTMRPLATGLSGGVTAIGTLASVAGAAVVACIAALFGVASFVPVAAGGIAGALIDSVLGATVQALRWCPTCKRECETNPHVCGTPTVRRRGIEWLENDAVNFAATLSGALVAGVLVATLPGRL